LEIQVAGMIAELQLVAVQTAISVAVRIEFATIGGVSLGAASTLTQVKICMAITNVADILTGEAENAN
jgi:hypothetical protein